MEEANINGEMMRLRYEKEMERMIGRKDMRKEREKKEREEREREGGGTERENGNEKGWEGRERE